MRRALIARDGGCRFPGCTNHRFCDGHHIEHWQHGGETCLDNLVLLCRHHHRLVHEGGFDCRKTREGEICFVDPRQQRIRAYARPEPVTIAESLVCLYRRYDGHPIDSGACEARWHAGTGIDRDQAMIVAFQQPLSPSLESLN